MNVTYTLIQSDRRGGNNMFCSNCGTQQDNNVSFCNQCGTSLNNSQSIYQQAPTSLIGFSTKINDPSFTTYKKKSIIWSFLFATILAIIVIIGFPIYGNVSGELDWPNSLYYGFAIGAMFILIALLQTLKKWLDKTWDGVVINKDTYRVKERNRKGGFHYHTFYVIKIKKDSGGTKKHKWKDIPGLYDYYNVGDRVRHHKGFSYYEKYDKSRDNKIMCAACMAFNDKNIDVCTRCKCLVLK